MVTINRAVDHLIDVLAGEDVPVVGSKATRVDQLANMIADGEIVIGGGGGATKVAFEENNTNDGSNITYTLTNAAAVFDAYEAVLSADDPLAASLDYIGAVSQLAAETQIYPAFILYHEAEGESSVSFGDAAGDMDSRQFSDCLGIKNSEGITLYIAEDVEVTRADIDPETGIASKTVAM